MIINDKWADDLKEIKEIAQIDDGITKKNGQFTSSMGFAMASQGASLDDSIQSTGSVTFEKPKLKLADEELMEKYKIEEEKKIGLEVI